MVGHTPAGGPNKSYRAIHGRASIPDTRESSIRSSSRKSGENELRKDGQKNSQGQKNISGRYFKRCSSKPLHVKITAKDLMQVTCQTPSKERRNNWHAQRELQLLGIRDKRNAKQFIDTGVNEFHQQKLEEVLRHKQQRRAKTQIPITIELIKEDVKAQDIEQYSVGKKIGQGGYAVVREAVHKISQAKVAIKSYDKQCFLEPQLRKCVNGEISILKQLQHPNIVQIYDTIETSTHLHIVMERLTGTSLYSMLKQKKKLDTDQARQIFRQLLSTLSYCHHNGVVHRDIKLENIIIDNSNNLKLIDFGFSTQLPPRTKTNVFCGTPPYMAPEIVSKTEYLGEPVDAWASCVLLFVLLSGEFPFKANNNKELFKLISSGRIQWPGIIPEGAKSLIEKGLALNPRARATVDDLLQEKWLRCPSRFSLLTPPDSESWAFSTSDETFDHSIMD